MNLITLGVPPRLHFDVERVCLHQRQLARHFCSTGSQRDHPRLYVLLLRPVCVASRSAACVEKELNPASTDSVHDRLVSHDRGILAPWLVLLWNRLWTYNDCTLFKFLLPSLSSRESDGQKARVTNPQILIADYCSGNDDFANLYFSWTHKSTTWCHCSLKWMQL